MSLRSFRRARSTSLGTPSAPDNGFGAASNAIPGQQTPVDPAANSSGAPNRLSVATTDGDSDGSDADSDLPSDAWDSDDSDVVAEADAIAAELAQVTQVWSLAFIDFSPILFALGKGWALDSGGGGGGRGSHITGSHGAYPPRICPSKESPHV